MLWAGLRAEPRSVNGLRAALRAQSGWGRGRKQSWGRSLAGAGLKVDSDWVKSEGGVSLEAGQRQC